MSRFDDATPPPPRRVPPVHYGGPERLFGVAELAVDGAVATGVMELDGRHANGVTCGAAAVAVLVDDVLGYAIVTACPVDRWSVSTDITLDLVAPLPPGTRLTARARAVYADESMSLAECRVHDADGRLVALATQRGRFVPPPLDGLDGLDGDEAAETAVREAIVRGTKGGLAALIGARPANAGTMSGTRAHASAPAHSSTVSLVARPELGNRFGALHGGVALAASLLAAEHELERLGRAALAPTSIRITYPRPIGANSDVQFTAAAHHAGRSFAVLDVAGEVDGRPATHAQVTAHPFGQ